MMKCHTAGLLAKAEWLGSLLDFVLSFSAPSDQGRAAALIQRNAL